MAAEDRQMVALSCSACAEDEARRRPWHSVYVADSSVGLSFSPGVRYLAKNCHLTLFSRI